MQDYAIESPATAPEIVDGFFPTEVDYWGGGEVEGWILFRDPDGDIELVCLTLVGPSGWQGESCEDVSFEVRHKTEARRSFSFPAPYLCWEGAGEYRIELQVIDFEGLRSNVWVFEYSLSGGS